MDNTEQLIAIYHTGFIVSILVMCIGLALAVLFFFVFDIKNIFMIRTGRAKQKSIADMQERNLQTGKLSSSPYTDSGEIRGKKERRKTGAFKTGAFRSSDKKQGDVVQPAKRPMESTVPLQESSTVGQADQTTLNGPLETSLLSTPSSHSSSDETLYQNGSSQYEAQGTEVLADGNNLPVPAPASSGFKFTVTERTIVIHTNESI